MLWKIAKAGKDPTIFFAAEELARYLKAMDTQAETPILLFPAYDPSISALWLGVCPEIAAQVDDPKLDDAYRIDVVNGVGAVRGSNPRSVLMGVYRLLKEMGCAWVRPGADGEIIPKRSIADTEVHVNEKASYRHRGICIEGAVNYDHVCDMIDWMPKMGYNAYFIQFHTPVTFYNRWYDHTGNPLRDSEALTTREIEAMRDQTVLEIKKRGLLYHADGHGWTCEPFGIPGETWDSSDVQVPSASVKYLAKLNGRRKLHENVPLNTNLCYSNPAVRRRIADAVGKRCLETPEIDFVQVWFADGVNNHCECENCKKMRPSDWYVTLLNEIDEKLTKLNLPTKVVFLMYVDLLWEPQQVTLNNPDRFVLMFAPITRTYSSSIADAPLFDENNLPPYERNHLKFPRSVSENLAWMRKWRKQFSGDGFDYDYHFGRDHYSDPGYYDISRTLFRDMQSLHSVGLNGMVSCQAQRVFLPSGLGMAAMAAALWDEHADFDQVAKSYFRDAFGADGEIARTYLETLSVAFDPVYLRGEKPAVNPESAESLGKIPGILDTHAHIIAAHAEDPTLPENIRKSWKYLIYHAELCRLVARAFQLKALGNFTDARTVLEDSFSYVRQHEPELNHVFDLFKFQATIRPRLEIGIDSQDFPI